ncbi:unnamed protein product [Heterobilharzia americana]|nr:unnamed protein product [Heterobilharzia americana]CAH8499594.1 unnamed protein product [Heterobilharzia americana]
MLQPKGDCIFCSIAHGLSNEPIRSETNNVVIFADRYPKAKYHFQCVPKQHIRNAKQLKHEDVPLVVEMVNCGKAFITSQLHLNPDDFLFGFHWPPFNSVHHLHMHILGPKKCMNFNPMFDSRFHIFKKVEKVLSDLHANIQVEGDRTVLF